MDILVKSPQDGQNFGIIFDPEASARALAMFPSENLYQANPQLESSSEDTEDFLFDDELAVTGNSEVRPPHHQTVGNCTSEGTSGAIEDLEYVLINKGSAFEFKMVACEPLYGLGRTRFGSRPPIGDGAVTAYVVAAACKFGFLARQPYQDDKGDQIDLSTYSGSLCRQLGSKGVPSWLDPIMSQHVVKDMTKITSVEMAHDALHNKKPIICGSSQGFSMTRDSSGFCKPQGVWQHCTYWRGQTNKTGKRKGFVYQQSWGPNMPSGNKDITTPAGRSLRLPEGAFFIDDDVAAHMIAAGDTWVISDEVGFPGLDFKPYA